MRISEAVWLVRVTGMSPLHAAILLEVDLAILEDALTWMCTCGHQQPCDCLTHGCPCIVQQCPCAYR